MNYIKKRAVKFKYTLDHKRAFLFVEKMLTGRNSTYGYLHDVDKLVMYPFLPMKVISKIHRKFSTHHISSIRFKTETRLIQTIIDYECGHITKKDKPERAREYIINNIPEHYDIFEPLLDRFGI